MTLWAQEPRTQNPLESCNEHPAPPWLPAGPVPLVYGAEGCAGSGGEAWGCLKASLQAPGGMWRCRLAPCLADMVPCQVPPLHRSVRVLCGTFRIWLPLHVPSAGRLEELFSLPHPPTLLLPSCKAIMLLAGAGLRGCSPRCQAGEGHLGVAHGAVPALPATQQHHCGASSFHVSQWKLLPLTQAGD